LFLSTIYFQYNFKITFNIIVYGSGDSKLLRFITKMAPKLRKFLSDFHAIVLLNRH